MCFPHTVFAVSKEVSQTPHDLLKKHGESSEIQCSHKILGYDRILWYKYTRDREYRLMGYNFLTGFQLEPEFNNQVTLTGNGDSKATLTIKSTTSTDISVQHLHSVSHFLIPLQKLSLRNRCTSSYQHQHTCIYLFLLRDKNMTVLFYT